MRVVMIVAAPARRFAETLGGEEPEDLAPAPIAEVAQGDLDDDLSY